MRKLPLFVDLIHQLLFTIWQFHMHYVSGEFLLQAVSYELRTLHQNKPIAQPYVTFLFAIQANVISISCNFESIAIFRSSGWSLPLLLLTGRLSSSSLELETTEPDFRVHANMPGIFTPLLLRFFDFRRLSGSSIVLLASLVVSSAKLGELWSSCTAAVEPSGCSSPPLASCDSWKGKTEKYYWKQ